MAKNLGRVRTNTYTAYADNDAGLGFSLSPVNKSFIGHLHTGLELDPPVAADFAGVTFARFIERSLDNMEDGDRMAVNKMSAPLEIDMGGMNTLFASAIDLGIQADVDTDIIEVIGVQSRFNYSGAQYTNGGDLQLVDANGTIFAKCPASHYTSNKTNHAIWQILNPVFDAANGDGLFITCATSNPATGEGMLQVQLTYITKTFD